MWKTTQSWRVYDITVYTVPCCTWDATTWTGTTNDDWNTGTNWDNGIPCCTWKATIPDVTTVSNYPIITADDNACCDTIFFEAGGAVLGLENLTYNKAFVQLEVSRDHWYTLTAPLKDMYSGDYFFNGAPETYMRLFDTTSPDAFGPDITYTGTFTRSFATLEEALTPGEAFAFRVSQKTWHYPTGSSNIATDTTITFPRITAAGALVRSCIPYSAFSGAQYTWIAKTLTKDSTNRAYRLALEDASDALADTTITLPTGLSLIGNPMMTHLDLETFLTANSNISDYVKLWTGSAYETYDGVTNTWDGSYTGDKIAPMQSFVVNSVAGGNITFDISAHFSADDGNSQLRSANTGKENMLFIKATKDGKTTGTVITNQPTANNNYGDDDIFKLFTPLPEIADVYSVADGYALAFNKFNTYPFTAPLGIKTSDYGKVVKLNFNGAESFADVDVYLINSQTGDEQNLKENPTYEFNYDETNRDGALFISFRNASLTTDDSTMGKDYTIQIYSTEDSKIQITSAPKDLIREIIVFTSSGKMVEHHCCFLKTSNFEIPANKNQIYLVQVFTDKNTRMAKILVK